jgi:hypothetical protein
VGVYAVKLALLAFVALLLLGLGTIAIRRFGCGGGRAEGDYSSEETSGSQSTRLFFKNFGVVRDRTPLFHRFLVRNQSQVPWVVQKVTPSCSCAAAVATPGPIPPGEVFALNVRYAPSAKEGVHIARVLVLFDSELAPALRFRMQVRTVHDLSVPASVDFNAIARGKQVTRTIHAYNTTGTSWDGLSVSSDEPWLTTVVHDAPPDAEGDKEVSPLQHWIIQATVSSDRIACGAHVAHLHIKAKSGDADYVEPRTLPVSARVNAPLAVIPAQAFLGELKRTEEQEFSLILCFSEDVLPDVKSQVDVTHDLGSALVYDIGKVSNTSMWAIKCRFKASELPLASDHCRGTIRVRLRTDKSEIEVPVVARVR